MPEPSMQCVQAGNHTLAIANPPSRLALFKRSDSGQKLRLIDRLLEPRKGQPDAFTSVSVIPNPTTAKERIVAVTARTICPHSVDTRPGNQSRFIMT
eukprot:295859-Amphidinium_carterae.2